jgi:hypothetical protein
MNPVCANSSIMDDGCIDDVNRGGITRGKQGLQLLHATADTWSRNPRKQWRIERAQIFDRLLVGKL